MKIRDQIQVRPFGTLPTGETVSMDVRQIDVPTSVSNLTSEAHLAPQIMAWKANADVHRRLMLPAGSWDRLQKITQFS